MLRPMLLVVLLTCGSVGLSLAEGVTKPKKCDCRFPNGHKECISRYVCEKLTEYGVCKGKCSPNWGE